MTTPTTNAGAVLDAARRHISADRTASELAALVERGHDPTIRDLLRRAQAHEPLAPIILLAGLSNDLLQRARWNTHGHATTDALDEHATLAYLVIADADPTLTRQKARLLWRVTSRYRKQAATQRAVEQRHVTTVESRDGEAIVLLDRIAELGPSVERRVESRLALEHVLALADQAIATGRLRPEAWLAFLARRVGGQPPRDIAGAGGNPSTIRSQIHRTANWLNEQDCAA